MQARSSARAMRECRQRAHDVSVTSRRALLIALFGVYLLELVWTVIWKLDVPYVGAAVGLPKPIKLIPFVASRDAGGSAPLEVLVNVLLFVPFGAYLRVLAPRWRWWAAAGVFAGASLVLEITQHVISVGSFDITDVIVNTAGGLVGFALLRRVSTRVLVIWTVISVVAIGVFVVSPLHYEQPRDLVVPRGLAPSKVEA